MKFLKSLNIILLIALLVSGISSCGPSSDTSGRVQYSIPSWAPPYTSGIRYYYLPDIETYYDLSGRQFIYLDNGQWIFTTSLPPIYSSYDLFNGFVIALDFNVYQPWMHHQYYVYHYPRYYYNNVYRTNDIKNIRGFNENGRKPVYRKQEDRSRVNDLRRNDRIDRPQITTPPQKTNYYGKEIGKPVRVRPNMKENKNREKRNVPGVRRFN